MDLDYKILSSIIGIIIALIGYYFYIKEIYRGKNRPHSYSWFIWGLLFFIGFGIQVLNEGGYGSFIMLVEAILCFVIAFISIKKGEKNITFGDKVSLFSAFIAIFFWLILDQPVISVVLIIAIDSLGFFPTIRKSYIKPYEESISVYLSGIIVFTAAIIGLTEYSLLTYAYPFAIITLNIALVIIIFIRRSVVGKN